MTLSKPSLTFLYPLVQLTLYNTPFGVRELAPAFLSAGLAFPLCSPPTPKNILFKIYRLRNAIFVSPFFSNPCVIDGGYGGSHLKVLDHRLPISYSLSFHILAHSSAFFCTCENHNSFLFMELRTLRQKKQGVANPFLFFPHHLL